MYSEEANHVEALAPKLLRQQHTLIFKEVGSAVDLVSLHGQRPERYPFFLESVATGTPRSRFDILLAFPQGQLTLDAGGALRRDGAAAPPGASFLDALDAWWRELRSETVPGQLALPFTGGWFVYLAYELVGQIEPVVGVAEPDHPWPIAVAVRMPAALVRDHQLARTIAVCETGFEALLDELVADAANSRSSGEPATTSIPDLNAGEGTLREESPDRFLKGVDQIKRYIREGDVFQVNLSRAWRGRLAEGTDAHEIYRRLRLTNPAPFAGSARLDGLSILSSSPERLYSVRGSQVETRPIAGTHPRNKDIDEDRALSAAMLAHPKERAEHIMLIDLERNDLGRVCRTGSVEVNELMALESYTHVHHIVSNVSGELRPDTTPGQVIRAVFPGGTITGCPKVRCMEIIRELEQVRRGPYTGALGYLNRTGNADFNILIRTVVTDGREVVVRAGAGIVADSVPERELDETRQKARGPLRALQGLVE